MSTSGGNEIYYEKIDDKDLMYQTMTCKELEWGKHEEKYINIIKAMTKNLTDGYKSPFCIHTNSCNVNAIYREPSKEARAFIDKMFKALEDLHIILNKIIN